MASTDPDELRTVLSEQRRELMAAQVLESDLDLAFRLQMQEAITASLSLHRSTSTSTSTAAVDDDDDDVFNFATLQTEELSKFEQETLDRKQCLAEFNKIRDDFQRQIHDRKVASDILVIPEEEWREHGDFYEKPYGEGSSSANADSDEVFRVYSKGLVSDEIVQGRMVVLAAIGVAICDSRDNVIFELRKPLVGNGKSRQGAEVKALIEGLRAAFDLDLKRVTFFVDYHPLFQFVTGRWPPKQRKIATLVNQVSLLQRKFTHCNPSLVARNDIKFAFKLARDAIVSQITGPTESSGGKNLKETCVICLEDSDVDQMFLVDGCLHRYCFSCMKQHVEVKLLHGMIPKCPHENCKTELNIDSCEKFLTPKLIEIMRQRIKEAEIPVTEKLYCPYPRCSALMSKSEVQESVGIEIGAGRIEARRCTKCQKLFCIYCKVPWHEKLTCHEYKRLNPPRAEDAKLKSLATVNLWRQCVKCNHMIELAEGCYHMTCRCGFEFCYTCGAEWKNKKATCSCPLWDEENILYDEDDDDDDDFDEEEEEDEEEEYYDSDSDFY